MIKEELNRQGTIIALDQSYDNTGIAIMRDGKFVVLENIDMHDYKYKKSDKREYISKHVKQWETVFVFDIIAMEQPRRFPSIKTMIALYGIGFCLKYVMNKDVYMVNTITHHKLSTGNGKCDKAKMVEWANEYCKIHEITYLLNGEMNDHIADAMSVALAIYYGCNVQELDAWYNKPVKKVNKTNGNKVTHKKSS